MPARAPAPAAATPTVAEEDEESTTAVATPDSAQSDPTNANAAASGSGTSSGKKRKTTESIKESAAAMKKKKLAEKAEFDKKNAASAGPVGKPGKYDNRAPGAISKCGECGSECRFAPFVRALLIIDSLQSDSPSPRFVRDSTTIILVAHCCTVR